MIDEKGKTPTINNVYWRLELNVNDGQLDNLKALMTDMVIATQVDEPRSTNYEWFLSDDGKQCHLYERYTDSQAVMTQLGHFTAKFAERFLAVLSPVRLTVYGNASDDVRSALAGFGAVHKTQIGGCAR